MISDRHQKREIRQLEQELPRWQVLVDNITGIPAVAQQSTKQMFVFSSESIWGSWFVFVSAHQGWACPTLTTRRWQLYEDEWFATSWDLERQDFSQKQWLQRRSVELMFVQKRRISAPRGLMRNVGLIFLLYILCSTDYIGQSNQGQTHRCGSITRGTCLENIKKTRWMTSYIDGLLQVLSWG